MPKDVADWTTAIGAPWVAVGSRTTAGAGPDAFTTSAVPPEAQTLGIVVEGGLASTVGPIHVIGVTTSTAYQVNFAGQLTGFVCVRIRPDLDSQYIVSWSTSSGAGVTVTAAANPVDMAYPALGQFPMSASIPVAIASDQTALPVTASGGAFDVDANIDEVGGAAVSLGQKTAASSFPVVIASDQAIGRSGQQAMANSAPVVLASDQAAIPVSPSGGQFDVDANIDEVGGAAVSLGQKTAASSFPVVITSDQAVSQRGQAAMANSVPVAIASDQAAGRTGQNTAANSLPVAIASDQVIGQAGQKNMAGSAPVVLASDQAAIPVNASLVGGANDVDANLDEVGGVAFALGQTHMASSVSVAIADDLIGAPWWQPRNAPKLVQAAFVAGAPQTILAAPGVGIFTYIFTLTISSTATGLLTFDDGVNVLIAILLIANVGLALPFYGARLAGANRLLELTFNVNATLQGNLIYSAI